MVSRHRDELLPMGGQERAGIDDQRSDPALDKRCKGGIDVAAGPS
jgi:hypothetical protein